MAALAAFLDEVTAAGIHFGPVLQARSMTLSELEQLCMQWLSLCHREPSLRATLLDRIDRVLAQIGAPAPIDDAAFETVLLSPGLHAPAVALPFRDDHRPSAPPPAAGPELVDALWGDTVAAPTAPPAPATPFATVAELTLEQCAQLAALFVVDEGAARRELETLEVPEPVFRAQDRERRRDAIDRLGRGDGDAIERYDERYVGVIESVRGPITDEDYAHIVVATERGRLDATLARLGLGGARYGHIERARLTRMAKDPDLFMTTMDVLRRVRGEGAP